MLKFWLFQPRHTERSEVSCVFQPRHTERSEVSRNVSNMV